MGFIVHFQRCADVSDIHQTPGEWSEVEGAVMIPDTKEFSDKYQWSIEDDVLLVVEVNEVTSKRKNVAAFFHWDRVVPTEETES